MMNPPIFDGEVDEATADLIFQLQLEDAGVYPESINGDSRGPISKELAFELQIAELRSASRFLADQLLAVSMTEAVLSGGLTIPNNQTQENVAAGERQHTSNSNEDEECMNIEHARSNTEPGDTGEETLEELRIKYISGWRRLGAGLVSWTLDWDRSAWEVNQVSSSQSTHSCQACREEVHFINAIRVPCDHEYCRPCLEALFEASISDESLFPPRCCGQPIAASDTVRLFLRSDVVQRYEEKEVEFKTPNRIYCYSPSCMIFIPPGHIDNVIATCPRCRFTTCVFCKTRAHTGNCPEDTAMRQLLAMAKEKDWQRCLSCGRMVELDTGCNHIICHCSHQFCYICGREWKTCDCGSWDEQYLLAAPDRIIDPEWEPNIDEEWDIDNRNAQPGLPMIQNPENGRLAAGFEHGGWDYGGLLVALRQTHGCEHNGRWRYIPGRHLCLDCSVRTSKFIFECRHCKLRACNHCRKNGLRRAVD